MNKLNPFPLIGQEKSQESSHLKVTSLDKVDSVLEYLGFAANLPAAIDALRKHFRRDRVFAMLESVKYLLHLRIVHPALFPAQRTIGKNVGRHRKTINYYMAILERFGIVRRTSRGKINAFKDKTCEYELHPHFFGRHRWDLRHLFPVLKSLTIAWLMCPSPGSISTIGTQDSSLKTKIFKYSSLVCISMIERSPFSFDFRPTAPEKVRKPMIPSAFDHFSYRFELSEYGKLLFSCYTNDIVNTVVQDFLRDKPQGYRVIKKDIGDMWYQCNDLSQQRNIVPEMDAMRAAISHAGYTKETPVLVERDPEAQPRYEERTNRNVQKRTSTEHSPFMRFEKGDYRYEKQQQKAKSSTRMYTQEEREYHKRREDEKQRELREKARERARAKYSNVHS